MLKMATSEKQKLHSNEKISFRVNQIHHLLSISKSIGRIVNSTANVKFKSEVSKTLNVKLGHRNKTTQAEVMKLVKSNYQKNMPPDTDQLED